MATTPAPAGTIGHDQAAQILRISPTELTRLVGSGVVPRVSAGVYHPGSIIGAYIEHLRAENNRMAEQVKRAYPETQDEIAHYLDISDRRLRELLAEWAINHKTTPIDQLRVRYIRKLREEAAGRSSEAGDADLVTERALLARSQREGQELKNATARGEFAAIALLSDVLSDASAAVAEGIDQIPAALRRSCPDLPKPAIDSVMTEIARCRNEWARKTSALVVDLLSEEDQPIEDDDAVPLDD